MYASTVWSCRGDLSFSPPSFATSSCASAGQGCCGFPRIVPTSTVHPILLLSALSAPGYPLELQIPKVLGITNPRRREPAAVGKQRALHMQRQLLYTQAIPIYSVFSGNTSCRQQDLNSFPLCCKRSLHYLCGASWEQAAWMEYQILGAKLAEHIKNVQMAPWLGIILKRDLLSFFKDLFNFISPIFWMFSSWHWATEVFQTLILAIGCL